MTMTSSKTGLTHYRLMLHAQGGTSLVSNSYLMDVAGIMAVEVCACQLSRPSICSVPHSLTASHNLLVLTVWLNASTLRRTMRAQSALYFSRALPRSSSRTTTSPLPTQQR